MLAENGPLEAGARIWDHSRLIDRVRPEGSERMLTRGARRVRYSDFNAISAAVASGGFTAVSPLRSGPFLLEAAGVGLGDGAVLAGRNSPLLVQGALPADTVWAVLPLGPDGPVLINGRAAGPNTLAVFGPGALHEAANHREAGWALVALPAALADRHLEFPARLPLLRRGAHALLACDPETWRQTARLLRSAAEVAVHDPEVFEVEEARRSLRSELLEAARDLLSGGQGGKRARIRCAPSDRQRLVRAVEDDLRAHPERAPMAADVAAALGVPAARLGRAIRATFGMGLAQYLLLRRLTLFRAALRAAGPGRRSPRDIALTHGFWHFGRLVKDYGEVFAEDLSGLFAGE